MIFSYYSVIITKHLHPRVHYTCVYIFFINHRYLFHTPCIFIPCLVHPCIHVITCPCYSIHNKNILFLIVMSQHIARFVKLALTNKEPTNPQPCMHPCFPFFPFSSYIMGCYSMSCSHMHVSLGFILRMVV